MSATSELLAEQVRALEEQIEKNRSSGEECSELVKQRDELAKRLLEVNSALTEGRKQILKG